jgi:hypothetical protein
MMGRNSGRKASMRIVRAGRRAFRRQSSVRPARHKIMAGGNPPGKRDLRLPTLKSRKARRGHEDVAVIKEPMPQPEHTINPRAMPRRGNTEPNGRPLAGAISRGPRTAEVRATLACRDRLLKLSWRHPPTHDTRFRVAPVVPFRLEKRQRVSNRHASVRTRENEPAPARTPRRPVNNKKKGQRPKSGCAETVRLAPVPGPVAYK